MAGRFFTAEPPGKPRFKLPVFVLICYTAIANTYTFTLKGCYEVEAVVQESDSNCYWLCADCLAACWGLTGSVSRASLMAQWEGGGFWMGNTCKPMADSCRCMAKTNTIL